MAVTSPRAVLLFRDPNIWPVLHVCSLLILSFNMYTTLSSCGRLPADDVLGWVLTERWNGRN